MTTTIAERVAAGVAWLDEHDPGWWRTDAPEDPTRGRDAQPIDLGRLSLSSPCGCILGHRWGHYANALLDAPLDAPPWRMGFDAAAQVYPDRRVEYRHLTAEWRRVIRERREAVTVDA